MTEPTVEAAARVLRRHGIRFVVVGGQAIAQSAATATRDVDVMISTDEYGRAVAALSADPEATVAIEGGAVTRFGVKAMGGAPLDLIDAGVFCGTHSPSEFFTILATEYSFERDEIRYVNPAAVWYTRLLTKRWRAYAEKIVTNIIDGLDPKLLEDVERMAHRFGTESSLGPRLAYVRERLQDVPEALLGSSRRREAD